MSDDIRKVRCHFFSQHRGPSTIFYSLLTSLILSSVFCTLNFLGSPQGFNLNVSFKIELTSLQPQKLDPDSAQQDNGAGDGMCKPLELAEGQKADSKRADQHNG